MKKLLITGDSYCASKNPKSWTNILADRLNAELTLAGAVSASLYYAYDNLIRLDDNHDYIVTLVTNPGRLSTLEAPYVSNQYSAKHYRAKAEEANDHKLYLKYKSAEMYYENLVNSNFDEFVHDMILQKLEEYFKNRNGIIYPNFKMSRYPSEYFTMLDVTDACFSRYFKKDNYNFYTELFQKSFETGNVINHSTIECQELIADHFYQLITIQKSNITIDDFRNLKLNDSYEYYFTPR